MQDPATENCSQKYSSSDVRIMYVIRWREDNYQATQRRTHCTQLPQQRKQTLQQNHFAHHQHSVTVSDDVSWQVKIGVHKFDCLTSETSQNERNNR